MIVHDVYLRFEVTRVQFMIVHGICVYQWIKSGIQGYIFWPAPNGQTGKHIAIAVKMVPYQCVYQCINGTVVARWPVVFPMAHVSGSSGIFHHQTLRWFSRKRAPFMAESPHVLAVLAPSFPLVEAPFLADLFLVQSPSFPDTWFFLVNTPNVRLTLSRGIRVSYNSIYIR